MSGAPGVGFIDSARPRGSCGRTKALRRALPLEPSALFLARTIADMAATILVAGLDGPARGHLEPGEAPGKR